MKVCLPVFWNSRLDYHHPPHGHWDSRDGRGYHSYYRGGHPQQQGTWKQHLCLQLDLNSQRCSSGWRCRTVELTGSLVDGAASWTTVPVGTFRELLCRGVQVGQIPEKNRCGIFIFLQSRCGEFCTIYWPEICFFRSSKQKGFVSQIVCLSETDDWWKDCSDCPGMISGEMPLSPAPLTRRTILTTQALWRAPKTQACHPAASSWVSTSMEPSWVKLLPPLTQVSRCLKVPSVSFFGSSFATLVLRACGGAAGGVGPAEVRHSACRRPLRSSRTADPRESGSVHPREHRPAGNPQPGGQQGGFSLHTKINNINTYVILIG